jgi:hypothetical protein
MVVIFKHNLYGNNGFPVKLVHQGARQNTSVERIVRIFNSLEEADAASRIFFAIRERAFPDSSEQGFERVYRVLELEQC